MNLLDVIDHGANWRSVDRSTRPTVSSPGDLRNDFLHVNSDAFCSRSQGDRRAVPAIDAELLQYGHPAWVPFEELPQSFSTNVSRHRKPHDRPARSSLT